MFEGVSVAVVTPFRDGAVDEDGLRRVIRHLLDQGVAGVVATGSTGETPTLSLEERRRVWAITVEETRGKAFAVAGTGTNSTRESIEITRLAAEAGVDGCMVVAPYYNKPTQDGIARHVRAVADAVDVPLIVYNVPSRTGVNILPGTLVDLAGHERVAAVKEASGSVDQATEILARCPLTVLSGDDSLTLPMVAAGARGVVSVAGHVVGKEMTAMLAAHRSGKVEEAAALHRRLFPLIKILFGEPNPAPVKAALAELGLIRNELRSPLFPVAEATLDALRRELGALGLTAPAAGRG